MARWGHVLEPCKLVIKAVSNGHEREVAVVYKLETMESYGQRPAPSNKLNT